MKKSSRIYLAGHNGLVGSAILRKLQAEGHTHIVTRTFDELDLTDQKATAAFFRSEQPEYVFLAAARVGGILANNTYPAEFIYQNLMIQNNVLHQSYYQNVKRLLFLGSSCIYPRSCPQPIKESYLLTGALEKTNAPYAVAKIAGIEMCWSYNRQYGTDFIPVMPTNLYGPHDNFDIETSHVIPALIHKFQDAKEKKAESVLIWGTGKPKREFLFVDDLADACLYFMNLSSEKIKTENLDGGSVLINIGVGKDITIEELAGLIGKIVGFEGKMVFDTSKPDGTMQKCLDVNRASRLGWTAKTELEEGIIAAYQWYKRQLGD